MHRFSLKELKMAIDLGCDQFEDNEMVIVGSMSILGHTQGELPPEIPMTMDIDLYPKNAGDKVLAKTHMALDYGEGSQFRADNGWYIEVLGEWTTFRLTPGWQDRTNKVVTEKGNVGHCLSPLDLAYNKATVARVKDFDLVKAMVGVGYISYGDLKKFLTDSPPVQEEHQETARQFMGKLEQALNSPLPEVPHVPKKDQYLFPQGAGKAGYAAAK